MNKGQACQALFRSYCDAHPLKSKAQAQAMCNDKWNEVKKDSDWLSKVTSQIDENKRLTTKRKAQSLSFFSNLPGPTSSKKSNNAPDPDS